MRAASQLKFKHQVQYFWMCFILCSIAIWYNLTLNSATQANMNIIKLNISWLCLKAFRIGGHLCGHTCESKQWNSVLWLRQIPCKPKHTSFELCQISVSWYEISSCYSVLSNYKSAFFISQAEWISSAFVGDVCSKSTV